MRLVAKTRRRRLDCAVAFDVDGRRPVHEHRADRAVCPDQVERAQAAELAQSQTRQALAPFRLAWQELAERRLDRSDGGRAWEPTPGRHRKLGPSLGRHRRQQRGVAIARRHVDQRRGRSLEDDVGHDGSRCAGLVAGPRVFGGGRFGGEGDERRARCALPQSEKLADQAAQLIARQGHAARAEIIVDDPADRIGDLGRRAAGDERRLHRLFHLGAEGAPGLLHLAAARDVAAQRKDLVERAWRAPFTAGRGVGSFKHGILRGSLVVELLPTAERGHRPIRLKNDFEYARLKSQCTVPPALPELHGKRCTARDDSFSGENIL